MSDTYTSYAILPLIYSCTIQEQCTTNSPVRNGSSSNNNLFQTSNATVGETCNTQLAFAGHVPQAIFRAVNHDHANIKGTGSYGSAHAHYKNALFCQDMLYCLCKQYDHVKMLSKSKSVHFAGSHLHLINLNICK